MAFLKTARAGIIHRDWSPENWGNWVGRHRDTIANGPYRTASSSPNLIAQASEILKEDFDPRNYLLTHATIVASVDTEDVPNVKLGTVTELGRKIDRRWPNYHITPETERWTNNNGDSWDRPVLLKSYRTFVGSHNWVEHVQVEEQSKGRIIDAVARDIGPSIYVDILTATNRRHASLIRDIESGRLNTLSMGCFLAGTQVTMADGTRVAIEDVVPGDMVLTHRGRAREVVNKQIRTYRGPLRRIKAVGVSSTIRATANHGFHVLRAAKTCACGCGEALPTTSTLTRRMTRRFKHGHDKRIYNPNNTYSLEEARRREERVRSLKEFTFEKIRADELEIGDFLAFPRPAEGVSEGWTSGKARLVGYFLAEGSYLKHRGRPVEVQFSFSMSERDTYVREVVDLLRQEFPSANDPWVQERPTRGGCVVHMTGPEAVEWFYRHCGEYSHGKRMSAETMSLPVELHRHLVGAWINGDGTFGEANKTLSGTSVSYDLACQMHYLLARCGVFARMGCDQEGRSIEVSEAIGAGWLPDPETRKRPALTLVMGLTGQQPLAGFSDKVGRNSQAEQQLRVLDDYVIFPITSIESEWYEGPVHNMEVEEDHTYVVEGVTVYNCSVTETQCTKCGNVAADETEMCPCVKYEKHNVFFDSRGVRRKVAELCGHHSLDPTGGVNFIEASWVAVPAFAGAVTRNILQPETISVQTTEKMRSVLASPPPEWVEGAIPKAASFESPSVSPRTDVTTLEGRVAQMPAAPEPAPGGMPGMPGGMPGMPGMPGAEEKDPLEELEDEVEKFVVDKVKKKLRKKLREEVAEKAVSEPELGASTNENVNHQASDRRIAALVSGTSALLRIARSDVELLDGVARLSDDLGVEVSRDLYRAALRVGSTEGHPSLDRYLSRAAEVLGRKPTTGEAKTLVRLGRILSLRKKTRF